MPLLLILFLGAGSFFFLFSEIVGKVASHSKYGKILVELKLQYIVNSVRHSEE